MSGHHLRRPCKGDVELQGGSSTLAGDRGSRIHSPSLRVTMAPRERQCCCPDIPRGREAFRGAHSWPLTSCKVPLQSLSLCLQPTTDESRKVKRQTGMEHKRPLPISCCKPWKRRLVADRQMRSMLELSVSPSSPGNPEREPSFVPAATAPTSSPPCLRPFLHSLLPQVPHSFVSPVSEVCWEDSSQMVAVPFYHMGPRDRTLMSSSEASTFPS